jgi:hypothetical protein
VAFFSTRTTDVPQHDCGSAALPQLPFMLSQHDLAVPNEFALNAKLKLGVAQSTNASSSEKVLRTLICGYDSGDGKKLQPRYGLFAERATARGADGTRDRRGFGGHSADQHQYSNEESTHGSFSFRL